MKKKTKFYFVSILFFVIVILILYNFQTLKKNYLIAFHKSGLIYHLNNGILDGEVDTYLNGKLYQRENYKNGVLDGWQFVYYNNGNLKIKVFYKGIKIDGVSFNYYKNRRIMSEESFVNGNADGPKTVYYQNGQIEQKLFRKNNKDEGKEYAYYEDGNLMYTRNWASDKLYGELYFYFEDHKVKIYHAYDILGEKFYLSRYDDAGKLVRSEGVPFSNNVYSIDTIHHTLIMLKNNNKYNSIRDLYITVSNPPHNATAIKITINNKVLGNLFYVDNNTIRINNAFRKCGIYKIVIDGVFVNKLNKITYGAEYELTIIRSH